MIAELLERLRLVTENADGVDVKEYALVRQELHERRAYVQADADRTTVYCAQLAEIMDALILRAGGDIDQYRWQENEAQQIIYDMMPTELPHEIIPAEGYAYRFIEDRRREHLEVAEELQKEIDAIDAADEEATGMMDAMADSFAGGPAGESEGENQ